jgi:hypothetical protein
MVVKQIALQPLFECGPEAERYDRMLTTHLTAAGVRLRQPELDDAAVEDRVREIFLRAAAG